MIINDKNLFDRYLVNKRMQIKKTGVISGVVAPKIKATTLKQLKVMKDNKFIDKKVRYYLKPSDSPAFRFYSQPKIHKPGESKMKMLKMKRATPRTLPHFPTTSEMFEFKITR